MFAYIVRRVISGILLLIVMSMVTFLLFFAAPVHPENFACGKNCSPAQKEQTKKALGYDEPVHRPVGQLRQGLLHRPRLPRRPEAARGRLPSRSSHCPAPLPRLLQGPAAPTSTT